MDDEYIEINEKIFYNIIKKIPCNIYNKVLTIDKVKTLKSFIYYVNLFDTTNNEKLILNNFNENIKYEDIKFLLDFKRAMLFKYKNKLYQYDDPIIKLNTVKYINYLNSVEAITIIDSKIQLILNKREIEYKKEELSEIKDIISKIEEEKLRKEIENFENDVNEAF